MFLVTEKITEKLDDGIVSPKLTEILNGIIERVGTNCVQLEIKGSEKIRVFIKKDHKLQYLFEIVESRGDRKTPRCRKEIEFIFNCVFKAQPGRPTGLLNGIFIKRPYVIEDFKLYRCAQLKTEGVEELFSILELFDHEIAAAKK
jgi:hypothetical protein